MKGKQVTRRTAMAAAGCGAAAVVLGQAGQVSAANKGEVANVKVAKYTSKDFYDATGKFQVEKGKQAYLDMMKRLGYPISEPVKKNLLATDFATGDFCGCGLGFILWHNSEKYGYCSIEIFLLPGQMIAEHAHGKSEKHPAKMEAWAVRHGMIHTFGEGEPTKPLPVELPASQKEKFVTVWNAQPLMGGEVRELNRLEAMHFMIAGPEGAIVTEFSTYHDGPAIKFTNPGVKF